MAKDAVATMGAILPDDAGGRDAVHVAVVSCVADLDMWAGKHVGIYTFNGTDYLASGGAKQHIGIVDPFLKDGVKEGQRFWLYLYPRTITGLNHHWTHPAFEDNPTVYAPPKDKLASEQWLRNFIETNGHPRYELIIAAAEERGMSYSESHGYSIGARIEGEYFHFSGTDAGGVIPSEFWDHIEVVTGRKMTVRPQYFSCSC